MRNLEQIFDVRFTKTDVRYMMNFVEKRGYKSMKFVPNSIEKLNCGVTRVVPVLASFDSAGTIRPLYVRITGEAYKILSCYVREYGPLMVYTCTINNRGMQRELTLTYHSRECCWTTQL